MKVALGIILAAALASAAGAQAPAQQDPNRPKGQMPTLGRPTQETDKVPVFDFDYFVGKWTFEWEVPEGPLGPQGVQGMNGLPGSKGEKGERGIDGLRATIAADAV